MKKDNHVHEEAHLMDLKPNIPADDSMEKEDEDEETKSLDGKGDNKEK